MGTESRKNEENILENKQRLVPLIRNETIKVWNQRISLQDYKIPYKFERKKLIITGNFYQIGS